jgi:hypothetical protein
MVISRDWVNGLPSNPHTSMPLRIVCSPTCANLTRAVAGMSKARCRVLTGSHGESAGISSPRASVCELLVSWPTSQSGNILAALDRLLGASRPTSAFAVAVTDSHECKNALKPRTFKIEYDETIRALDVACSLGGVR